MTIKKQTQNQEIRPEATTERVNFFSDGIFAIIITIMILELKHPSSPTLAALGHEWSTWISYIVSYTFIAIVWINHHYLLQHAVAATLRLMWANFAHLFTVSLIPFFTDWIAESQLSPTPVAMYALVFLLVNITYLCLIWQTMCVPKTSTVPGQLTKLLHRRSALTITLFTTSMIVAIWLPYVAFGIICCCLVLYLRPDLRSKKMNTQ